MANCLPLELWYHVFSLLPGSSLRNAEAACGLFRAIVRDPSSRLWRDAVVREFGDQLSAGTDSHPQARHLAATDGNPCLAFPWKEATEATWRQEYCRRHLAFTNRCAACGAAVKRSFMISPHRSRPAVCGHCAKAELILLGPSKKLLRAAGMRLAKARRGLGRCAITPFYLSTDHTAGGSVRAGYYCLRWEVQAFCDEERASKTIKMPPSSVSKLVTAVASVQAAATTAVPASGRSVDEFLSEVMARHEARSHDAMAEQRVQRLAQQKAALRKWEAECNAQAISPLYRTVSRIAEACVKQAGASKDEKHMRRLASVASHLGQRDTALLSSLRLQMPDATLARCSWPPFHSKSIVSSYLDDLRGEVTVEDCAAELAPHMQREAQLGEELAKLGVTFAPRKWNSRLRALAEQAVQDSAIDIVAAARHVSKTIDSIAGGKRPASVALPARRKRPRNA